MKSSKIISRRSFVQITFGVAATAALAACGGGGGGDDSPKVNLREAFDKIQHKMTKDQVRAIVGRREDDESNYAWSEGDQDLRVFGGDSAIAVQWRGPGQTLVRELALGE